MFFQRLKKNVYNAINYFDNYSVFINNNINVINNFDAKDKDDNVEGYNYV